MSGSASRIACTDLYHSFQSPALSSCLILERHSTSGSYVEKRDVLLRPLEVWQIGHLQQSQFLVAGLYFQVLRQKSENVCDRAVSRLAAANQRVAPRQLKYHCATQPGGFAETPILRKLKLEIHGERSAGDRVALRSSAQPISTDILGLHERRSGANQRAQHTGAQ